MSGTGEGTLLSRFGSTARGVIAEEAGAATGSPKLFTRPIIGEVSWHLLLGPPHERPQVLVYFAHLVLLRCVYCGA